MQWWWSRSCFPPPQPHPTHHPPKFCTPMYDTSFSMIFWAGCNGDGPAADIHHLTATSPATHPQLHTKCGQWWEKCIMIMHIWFGCLISTTLPPPNRHPPPNNDRGQSAGDGGKSTVLSCTYDLDACYPLPYPCPNPTRQQTVLMCKCLVFQFLSFKLNYKMIKCQGVTSPHLQLEFHFYSVHNHVYSFRNILHLPDCLYLIPMTKNWLLILTRTSS